MTVAALPFDLSVADVVVVGGVLGFAIERVVDALGFSRSAKTLRRENEDVVRRNGELEETVTRLEAQIDALSLTIDELRTKVTDLEQHSQEAVLKRLEELETKTLSVLTEIRDTLQKGHPA